MTQIPTHSSFLTDPELLLSSAGNGFHLDLHDHNTGGERLLRLHLSDAGVQDTTGSAALPTTSADLHGTLLGSVTFLADAFTSLARQLREQHPAPVMAALGALDGQPDEQLNTLLASFRIDGRTAPGSEIISLPDGRRAGIGGGAPRLLTGEGSLERGVQSYPLATREPLVPGPYPDEITVYVLTHLIWPDLKDREETAVVIHPQGRAFSGSELLSLAADGDVRPLAAKFERLDREYGWAVNRVKDALDVKLTAEMILDVAREVDRDTTSRELFRLIDQVNR